MDLPSFLWLWRIAAWSMGLSLLAYLMLAITGWSMFSARQSQQPKPFWIQSFHYIFGITLVTLVLLLLTIGIVGTLGHYGTLGHSSHLWSGLTAVLLVVLSAASATQINADHPWVRWVHIGTNITLLGVFIWVLLTGWSVVQKYLP